VPAALTAGRRSRGDLALLEQTYADESDPSKDDHSARARGSTVTDCREHSVRSEDGRHGQKAWGIHESRQAGFRRNANARISGASSENAAVNPDSILCARECHETLSHAESIPRQSRWKMPSKNVEMPSAISTAAAPMRPMTSGLSARHCHECEEAANLGDARWHV